MGTVKTKRVNLANHVRTCVFLPDFRAKSVRVSEWLRRAARSKPHSMEIKTVSAKYPLVNTRIRTMRHPIQRPETVIYRVRKVPLVRAEPATHRMQILRFEKRLKATVLHFESQRRASTFRWDHIRDVPVSRDALNLSRVPYPVISEFIRTLAEKYQVLYTDIHLIGVFDHIPMHYATTLTLDPIIGRLRFRLLDKPHGERRFLRVVYGRVRSSGELVQAFFPMR